MQKHFINLTFDDKDAVKAQFSVKWDNISRRWYAENAADAASAQALADELSGARHFAQQEQAAAVRKAEAESQAAAAEKAALALASAETQLSFAEISRAQQLLSLRVKRKFLTSDEESEIRRILKPLAESFGLETSTRNKSFNASAVRDALAAAKQALTTLPQ